jgi:hypothetical protein
MSTLTINHYLNQANSFISDIRNNRNGYYVFASRPQPWANSSGGDDESAIIATNNSIEQTDQGVYDDILFGKLLTDADVTNLIPRYNWVSNTVYSAYDHRDSDLYSKNFFVVTDKFEVYKCLDNNKGSVSTIKPSLTSTSGNFLTGDGYIWKYMYTIDSSSNTKFTSAGYVPVTANTSVKNNSVGGSIDVIRITNGGSGYSVYETGYIGGVINKFTIQLPQSSSNLDDYYVDSSIYLKSGFGAGQIRQISSSNGTSKQIVVNDHFDTLARLDLANVNGTVATGYFVEQPYDDINYLYAQGYFNIESTIAQSDTGTLAKLVSSNSSIIQAVRSNSNTLFALGLPIVDVSQSGSVKTGTVSVGNVGSCNLGIVLTNGTGYSANATITITANGSGAGAVAIAQSNTSGKITAINITTPGSGYFNAPTVTISTPIAQTFNSNTAVTAGLGAGSNNVIALATASFFVINDTISYSVSSGNTAVGGLVSGATYFIEFANSSVIALKTSTTGSRIALTKGPTQTGHSFTGTRATAAIYCDNQIVVGSGTQINTAANGYVGGEYIRIGANTTNNIRRVSNAVNNTILIVTTPFSSLFAASANLHYKMTTAAEPASIVINGANGYISNTNLSSVQLAISNSTLSGINYIIGEKVNMTNIGNVNQGANAVIAFSNASSVVLSSVFGTWLTSSGGTQFYISGDSSSQFSRIDSVQSNPNITIQDPAGTFKLGYPLTFRLTANGFSSGNATLIARSTLPNDKTEYVIGPTLKITGDGSNAIAIGIVNNSINTNYNLIGADVINVGRGYTQANIAIIANTNYGSNAKADAIISPVSGHGSDPITELGARYVGIDLKFDIQANESYNFPSYVNFRKIGILQNPQFKDVRVAVTDFDRVNLSLNTSSYSTTLGWTPGEAVVQAATKAAGLVVFGNSSFLQLKNVKGSFNASNTVYGYFSNSTANVNVSNSIYFTVGNSAQIITQANSGSVGVITSVVNNTVYFMSNVVGQFADGDVMYDSVSNAYATVDNIFTANGTKDSSSNFGLRFNQTARITLTSNTGAYANNEYVIQDVSKASGRIVSTTDEKDLVINSIVGSFSIGQTVKDTTTNANGTCIFANSTHIKLTSVSQNLSFVPPNTINNSLGATANIAYVLPVLVLSDVSDEINFQAGSNSIVGQTSGAYGTCNNYLLVTNPELVRESGKLIYSESFAPVTRSPLNKEEIKLVVKF